MREGIEAIREKGRCVVTEEVKKRCRYDVRGKGERRGSGVG